jgi:protease-4
MMARKPQDQLAQVFAEVQSILSGPSIQARCLDCQVSAPARSPAHDQTLLSLLRSWLTA